MSNKNYLEKMKKARDKNMHDLDMPFDELVDYPMKRIATALEIIAETLVKKNKSKEKITIKKPNIDVTVNKHGQVIY